MSKSLTAGALAFLFFAPLPAGAECAFSPNGSASATTFAPGNQALFLAGEYRGKGSGPYAEISVDDKASADNVFALSALRIDHSVNKGAGAGNRTALLPILNFNHALPGSDDDKKFYSAAFPQTYVYAPDGGDAERRRGNFYGLNALTQAFAGATNLVGVSGGEFDVSLNAGASADYKSILTLISVNSDAVQGVLFDAMLALSRDNTTKTGWRRGIAFGRPDSTWPIDPAGDLIGASPPGTGPAVAANGVDFSSVRFSQCAFKSQGFCVSPNGAVAASGFSAGSAQGLTTTVEVPCGVLTFTNGLLTSKGACP
ncbi:hypothetical protein [Methylocystis parvus]|uniref:Uncharacterized protein n=1 Tax=Methylocystis parvus TaxID=134 RepID=A0A6B8M2I1_9HYPH|nr:hypothetical protein [Methylocystis parvus]QGM97091.1 hypothetical protein F7D14_06125 [Methylocystis parvus]WBJ99006.1 hypothetical protein MMG94_13485 [Methylocystis parvus OBBP]